MSATKVLHYRHDELIVGVEKNKDFACQMYSTTEELNSCKDVLAHMYYDQKTASKKTAYIGLVDATDPRVSGSLSGVTTPAHQILNSSYLRVKTANGVLAVPQRPWAYRDPDNVLEYTSWESFPISMSPSLFERSVTTDEFTVQKEAQLVDSTYRYGYVEVSLSGGIHVPQLYIRSTEVGSGSIRMPVKPAGLKWYAKMPISSCSSFRASLTTGIFTTIEYLRVYIPEQFVVP